MKHTLTVFPDLGEFSAVCSSAQDKEILLELINNQLSPKRAPDVLDFVGRSYENLAKNTNFQKAIHTFFRDVIWRRFQKVVWSERGTVGVDVPIEVGHVIPFLKVAKLPTSPKQYVLNIMRFLQNHAALI